MRNKKKIETEWLEITIYDDGEVHIQPKGRYGQGDMLSTETTDEIYENLREIKEDQ
jgi:hypothetical protein